MTNRTRLLALLLALCFSLCACAYAEDLTDAGTPLVTIGDYVITRADVINTAASLYQNQYTETNNDYDYAIDYLINQQLLKLRTQDMGLLEFSDDEMALMRNAAEEEWENAIASYVDYYLSEDTDEARAAMREQAIAYYENTVGVTIEDLIESYKSNAAFSKLEALLFMDIEIDEADIQATFDMYVEQYRQQFEGNPVLYEYYQNYYGTDIWYTPAGYRGVLHILLAVDEALLNDYQTKQAGIEEDHAEGEAPAVTQADVDAAYQAILDSVAEKTADIYARYEAGETFQALIAEYNTDPGMTDPATLAVGYPVNKESVIYDPTFTAGAFSEKMTQVGAVSDPVVSSFGVHILYYLSDIPEGAVPLSDQIKTDIDNYLYNVACNNKFLEYQAEWIELYQVTYHHEAIDALSAPVAPEPTDEPAPEPTDAPQPEN